MRAKSETGKRREASEHYAAEITLLITPHSNRINDGQPATAPVDSRTGRVEMDGRSEEQPSKLDY
jgi:hypothetical protein